MSHGPIPAVLDPATMPDLLSNSDLAKITVAFATRRAAAGFTNEEIKKVLVWAQWTAFQAHVLKLILDGHVLFNVQHPNLNNFDDMSFEPVLSLLGIDGTTVYQKELKHAAEIVKDEKKVDGN